MREPYSAADGLVRVYAAHQPNGSGLVWAHGGAFAFGDLDMPESHAVATALAARGTTVIAVDYRLAPVPEAWARPDSTPRATGHHYPAASDDLLAAWKWTQENALALGIDATRLALGGASAGANLAAGATLRMLHADAAIPATVVLAYPTLHAVQPATTPELRAQLDADPAADLFGPAAVRAMYENYTGTSTENIDIYAAPGTATAEQLAGFAPVLMINGDVDELRTSGEAFAAALAAAAVPVEAVTEPGTRHGHLNRPEEPASAVSIERIAARLAAHTPTPLPTRTATSPTA